MSLYGQFFNETNIVGFDFSIGFKGSDVQKIEKYEKFSAKNFESKFYQVKNEWRHKVVPKKISENDCYKVIDLMI